MSRGTSSARRTVPSAVREDVPEVAPRGAGPAEAVRPAPVTRRRGGFALLGTVQVVLIFTLAAIAVPLPRIGREFGLDRADLLLLSTAYGLSFAGLLLLGGRLTDRYGGRRVLTAGLVVFALASALGPLAQGYGTLLTARFAQGVGAALVAPAAMGVLRALFPSPLAHGRAMATWGGLSVLGATAGNLGSGAVSAALSWRWTFAVPLATAAVALALAPRLLPATPPGPGRSLDVTGAALATAGIILASYGLVTGSAAPAVGGVALLVAFPLVERRARDPLLPPDFLRDRRRLLGLAAVALTAAGTATAFVLFSLALQEERGYSALAVSGAFVPFALVLLLAGRAAGPLISRFGARAVTAGGLATGAAGLALLAATGTNPQLPYATALLPGLLLLPAGSAASFAGAAVLATEGVPAHRTGLAGGVLNTAMECGPTVLFALLLTLGGDTASLAATAAAFALLAGALRLTR
ncbi:MFS transporter [Streptomyces sp. NPDC001941]|uniref:MFS transporter n=1 Tax=Streptomyces sp. NPDC001941 TaxID=3154659 RepID=UPI003333FCB8